MKHILKTLWVLVSVPVTIGAAGVLAVLLFAGAVETFKSQDGKPQGGLNLTVPTTIDPNTVTKLPSPTTKPEVKSATSQRESSTQKIYPSPTPDPDPIVNCRENVNCGGGTRRLKLSECNRAICCQIGNGWYFYPSNDECRKAQAAQAPRYTAPTPWPTTSLVTCQLSYGVWQLTAEKCYQLKAEDQSRIIDQAAKEYGQYLEEEWEKYQTQDEPAQDNQQNRVQECIAQAEQLYNELCNSLRQLNKDAGCESLYREMNRQKFACQQ